MHFQGIASTRSFDTGLTTAEDSRARVYKLTANYIFKRTMKTH